MLSWYSWWHMHVYDEYDEELVFSYLYKSILEVFVCLFSCRLRVLDLYNIPRHTDTIRTCLTGISFFLFSSCLSLHTAGECNKHNDTVQLETSRWLKRHSLSRASVGGIQRDWEQEHKWNQYCIWKPAFWSRIQNICGCFNLLYEYQYLDDSSDRYFIRIFSIFFIRLTVYWHTHGLTMKPFSIVHLPGHE